MHILGSAMVSKAVPTVMLALLAAIICVTLALIKHAHGEQILCQLERGDGDGWHYRTKIAPKAQARCWYVGERMISRDRLYWAEAPEMPRMHPWAEEHRWHDPTGWTHGE